MRKLLFFALLLSSSFAQANWTLVSKNDFGDFFYTDFSTLQRNGKFARVWEKTEYFTNEGGSKSARVYREYDCEDRSTRMLSLQTFTGSNLTGQTHSTSSKPSDWIFIPPNTPFFFGMNVAFKRK